MAKTANSENVRRDVEGPDFKGAIELIRGPIARNKSDSSSLGQDNSTIYKRIDKQYGVNRQAATMFASLDGMQADKRTDVLRSLFGLVQNAGYGNFDDLVDRAERAASEKPAATAEAKPALPDHPSDDSDLVKAGGEDPAPGEADGTAGAKAEIKVGRGPKAGKPLSGPDALAKVRGDASHLSVVPDAIN